MLKSAVLFFASRFGEEEKDDSSDDDSSDDDLGESSGGWSWKEDASGEQKGGASSR